MLDADSIKQIAPFLSVGSDHPTMAKKSAESNAIAAKVEAFLASGRGIHHIPNGHSSFNKNGKVKTWLEHSKDDYKAKKEQGILA